MTEKKVSQWSLGIVSSQTESEYQLAYAALAQIVNGSKQIMSTIVKIT